MQKRFGLAVAATLGLMAALPQTAQAEVKVFPYAHSINYCPAGLQPVVVGGEISCGKPNTHVSYQSAMSHPVAKKKHRKVHSSRHSQCIVGTKGCTYD